MGKASIFAQFLAIFAMLIFGAITSFAQTTEFSYQGFLSDNSALANGNFDFEFALSVAETGGSLFGTIHRLNVPVTNGVFSVVLDFGAFPAANRFLEMAVRTNGASVLTTLAPRSKLLSTPYATNAVNATNSTNAVTASQLNGVPANQIVQTNDSRLTDARNPLPNSPNYINNSTAQQTTSNFNVSGNGTAGGTLSGNIVSAATQYNIGNNRILSNAGTSNLFAGVNAGNANTNGISNTFLGQSAGSLNLDGNRNTFFGNLAGAANTTGSNNSIFGANSNVGSNNLSNATAIGFRAFVESNDSLVLGSVNGKNGATSNTFVGIGTTTPNTPLDIETQKALPDITPDLRLTNYGRFPYVSFRSSRGTRLGPTSITSDDTLLIIGAEGYTGSAFTTVGAASIYFIPTENWNTSSTGTKINFLTTSNRSNTPGTRMTINQDGNVGIGTGIVNSSPAQKLDVLGNIRVGSSGSLGCIEDRDGTIIAGSCPSDLRFKKNITPFGNLLTNFFKLRPVNFFWRADEFADKHFGTRQSFGLIAQEVEETFPELVAIDEQGYKIVNYSKLPLYTIQAVNELKAESDFLKVQIEQQRKQLEQQQNLIENLRTLVCQNNLSAEVCK